MGWKDSWRGEGGEERVESVSEMVEEEGETFKLMRDIAGCCVEVGPGEEEEKGGGGGGRGGERGGEE